MTPAEAARYLEDVVNPRIIQLGDVVNVTARYMRHEMSAELAMYEIELILEMRNK
jgi:hypothetical protein